LSPANVRALSRATIGTIFTAMGWAIRDSEFAGPKPWELKFGDRIVDTRIFFPLLAPYLTMGEVFNNPQNIKDNLAESAILPLMGFSRVAGTTLALVDVLRDRSGGGAAAAKFAGNIIGGFSTPIRGWIKDPITLLYPGEAVYKDQKGHPIIGPFLSNLPVFQHFLPDLYSPFRGGAPSSVEHPILKQMTGINPRRMEHLERETRKLNLEFRQVYPATGVPEADNIQRRFMGMIISKIPDPTLDPRYQKAPLYLKRQVANEFYRQVKAQARIMFDENKALWPEVYRQVELKKLDKNKRESIGMAQ